MDKYLIFTFLFCKLRLNMWNNKFKIVHPTNNFQFIFKTQGVSFCTFWGFSYFSRVTKSKKEEIKCQTDDLNGKCQRIRIFSKRKSKGYKSKNEHNLKESKMAHPADQMRFQKKKKPQKTPEISGSAYDESSKDILDVVKLHSFGGRYLNELK